MLCVGAYPEGPADAHSKSVTAYSTALAQVLMQGLNTFVCLMTDDEVARPNDLQYEVSHTRGERCSDTGGSG